MIDVFEKMTIHKKDGVTYMAVPGAQFDVPVSCHYWHEGPAFEGADEWRFRLTGANGSIITFSHPSELGCQIAIKRHFVDIGLINVPEDNSYLDNENQRIAEATRISWKSKEGPRVGDYVRMLDGSLKRFVSSWPDGLQTFSNGSFYIGKSAGVSYSGSLDSSIPRKSVRPTDETVNGKFWFFSHERAGAGRGVDIFLPCIVYVQMARFVSYTNESLIVHAMTEKEWYAVSEAQKLEIRDHEFIWQFAESKEAALAQHHEKHDEWSDAQQAGNREKETY